MQQLVVRTGGHCCWGFWGFCFCSAIWGGKGEGGEGRGSGQKRRGGRGKEEGGEGRGRENPARKADFTEHCSTYEALPTTITGVVPVWDFYICTYVSEYTSPGSACDFFSRPLNVPQGTEGCWNGPKSYPNLTECCVSYNDVPASCFPNPIDFKIHPQFKSFVNQTVAPSCREEYKPPASPSGGSTPSPPPPKGAQGGTVGAFSATVVGFLLAAVGLLL